MEPVQVIIRDLYGSIVFNQIFPDQVLSATAVSLFRALWRGPLSQVVILKPHQDGTFEKGIFRFRGGHLVSASGERIELPEVPDDISIDDDGHLSMGDEDDDVPSV